MNTLAIIPVPAGFFVWGKARRLYRWDIGCNAFSLWETGAARWFQMNLGRSLGNRGHWCYGIWWSTTKTIGDLVVLSSHSFTCLNHVESIVFILSLRKIQDEYEQNLLIRLCPCPHAARQFWNYSVSPRTVTVAVMLTSFRAVVFKTSHRYRMYTYVYIYTYIYIRIYS